jgi:hypothetical protein
MMVIALASRKGMQSVAPKVEVEATRRSYVGTYI